MKRIEKYYAEIGKIIKNLTFSYVNKKGEIGMIKKKGENLITKLDDTSWQKEFLVMKSH